MEHQRQFFIDGAWVEPLGSRRLEVINPASEEPIASIAVAEAEDVDRAVKAARRAFESFSRTSVEERLALLDRIIGQYQTRMAQIGAAISQEMGAPMGLAKAVHAPCGLGHLATARGALASFSAREERGPHVVVREPIGVCGLITPWNWPLNQIGAKVAPALAMGCTVVLKPSELAPLSALLFAEVLHEAGVPPGVFNLVNGDGPTTGVAMSSHPDIDMISITGSTRAGISVAEHAAKTIKRVTQELGGKSPNVLLDDVDFATVVARDTGLMCMNSGQSCNAPSRMLVPRARMAEAAAIAKATAEAITVGDPSDASTQLGPVAGAAQFDKIQGLIAAGIEEGATLECGGLGRPEGLSRGYYVKPTIFSNVRNDMRIAREEIFGPVLCIIAYDDEDDAIRIANDTPYGLCAYVSSADRERAIALAGRIRAGTVHINGANVDITVPFGGYKQSGNGREFGEWGLHEFLETKSILGHTAK
ncbi:aldehyde dehydrogenase family protein [Paraliomyxa miuraensis]|uniref:aldehyde dehydrogenase family protein n=1 Tax=Paraliomyxa miuraensis TaxID=376150 RepID=UPI00224DB3E1|nr:aldehyde dehydrogenase family protein [Paraliomyxa miuraensis]MCX4245170.1 aldehyde dehydrogenase family protein [Paraliomyxa miuraensis]